MSRRRRKKKKRRRRENILFISFRIPVTLRHAISPCFSHVQRLPEEHPLPIAGNRKKERRVPEGG
jgi:hypothetical protein